MANPAGSKSRLPAGRARDLPQPAALTAGPFEPGSRIRQFVALIIETVMTHSPPSASQRGALTAAGQSAARTSFGLQQGGDIGEIPAPLARPAPR